METRDAAAEEFDVFLSYSSKDKDKVKEIGARLKEHGLKLWRDEEQIEGGDNWLDRLQTGILHAKSVAVFIGQAGLGRQARMP